MAAWHELFPLDREPTMEDIAGYIDHSPVGRVHRVHR